MRHPNLKTPVYFSEIPCTSMVQSIPDGRSRVVGRVPGRVPGGANQTQLIPAPAGQTGSPSGRLMAPGIHPIVGRCPKRIYIHIVRPGIVGRRQRAAPKLSIAGALGKYFN